MRRTPRSTCRPPRARCRWVRSWLLLLGSAPARPQHAGSPEWRPLVGGWPRATAPRVMCGRDARTTSGHGDVRLLRRRPLDSASDSTNDEAAAASTCMTRSSATSSGRCGGYVFATSADGVVRGLRHGGRRRRGRGRAAARLVDERDRVAVRRCASGIHTGEASRGTSELRRPGGRPGRAADVDRPRRADRRVRRRPSFCCARRMTLRSLGEHRLRDLDRRMTVHQLVAEGLPSEFPSVRSLDPRVGNLPEQVTSFVGRDALLLEVARPRALEQAGDARRSRRRRQDAAGARGRSRACRASSRTACGSSSSPRCATRRP